MENNQTKWIKLIALALSAVNLGLELYALNVIKKESLLYVDGVLFVNTVGIHFNIQKFLFQIKK